MNACVDITGCRIVEGTKAEISITIDVETGPIGSSAVVDISASSVQINAAIEAAAKAAIKTVTGVVLGPTDSVRIFGGTVI